jgi:hypothetical protein
MKGHSRRSPLRGAAQWFVSANSLDRHGNPQPGPKFDYKLAWFERLIWHAGDLVAANVPVILEGDYNVVPTGCRRSLTGCYKVHVEGARLSTPGRQLRHQRRH